MSYVLNCYLLTYLYCLQFLGLMNSLITRTIIEAITSKSFPTTFRSVFITAPEGFPWDYFRKFFYQKVNGWPWYHGVETVPKISTS